MRGRPVLWWRKWLERITFDDPIRPLRFEVVEALTTDPDPMLHILVYLWSVNVNDSESKPGWNLATQVPIHPMEEEEVVLHDVRREIVWLFEHELDEWLKFDGKHVRPPHSTMRRSP